METDDTEMLSAAFHEAGHAVVSNALECIVLKIEIHYCEERNRWEGSYGHKLAEAYSFGDELFLLPKSAKVAIAGILSQAKYLMERRVGERLRFSGDNDLSAWFTIFRDKTRTEKTPGVLKVRMQNDNGGVCQEEIDGSLYSGRDAAGFIPCFDQVHGISHEALLTDVIAILDDTRRWIEIDRLARQLCDSAPTGNTQMRQLSQTEIAVAFASGK